jgi:hypothetical protein
MHAPLEPNTTDVSSLSLHSGKQIFAAIVDITPSSSIFAHCSHSPSENKEGEIGTSAPSQFGIKNRSKINWKSAIEVEPTISLTELAPKVVELLHEIAVCAPSETNN